METVKEDSSSELCDVTLKKEKENVLNRISLVYRAAVSDILYALLCKVYCLQCKVYCLFIGLSSSIFVVFRYRDSFRSTG